jgi:hypothetical protein
LIDVKYSRWILCICKFFSFLILYLPPHASC